jgi:class 3 adenylate cyclase/tetratricopeptide (TPR) repeat protein
MICPNCQFENQVGARFCNQCASRLDVSCPECGTVNPSGSKFCNQCACDLSEAKPTPLIDYSQPQSYIPKFLADKIIDTRKSIEGERKLVTVLFADVANYTSMSEKLDPEEVHQIMDGCFKILMDEIHRYEGSIDKFTGDGVMALFGAPVAHEDHAQRACYAALAILNAIGEYGEKIEKDCGVEFKMRVGLNSGLVIVGSVGNDLRMDYTAIGDTANLASRMETMAKPGNVLVSVDTYKLVKDFFTFESIGKVEVKGKEEPLEAYQLIEAGEVETRIEASVARGLTKFVGRKREITALKEAFEKAQSGSGQVVGIVGEAGVGKSRILLELNGALRKKEHTYLEGRCLHYGGYMAYLPFLDILKAYFDIKEGDREFVIKKKMAEKVSQLDKELKGILPPLHDILSLKIEDKGYQKLEPRLKRVRVFETIRDLLIRESQNKPLIIAIEDLHWIDKTSEEFLDYMIGSLAGARILLILLYRPEYTHQWGSKSYYSQIGVDQLSAETSAQLVQSILEEGEVVPELRELILNRAAGNPLFMEEFTHTLIENGSILKKDHQYILGIKASDIQVPDTIQGIIAARMDRLEDNLKCTMQVASVIGRDFAYRILQTITGMREELKSYLINLQGLEFIYEKSLFPELEYIFKHALIQDVAYNSLLLKRRKEIHERIGKAIEELYADRLEEFYEMLAHHYSMSDNTEKAYQYMELSGNKATQNYAKWEALNYYQEAINILNSKPDTEENKRKGIEIRLLMSIPMRYVSYPEGSLRILEEGEKLSKELGDKRSQAHFFSLISFYHSLKGEVLWGIEHAESCFREAEKVQDIDLMVPIGMQVSATYLSAGEFLRGAEVAHKASAVLEKTQRQSESFGWGFNVYAGLLAVYGSCLAFLGDFGKGDALCKKALRIAQEMDDLYCVGFVENAYCSVFSSKGDGEKVIEHSQNALKHLEETQFLTHLGLGWFNLGLGYHSLGELEKAREYIEKGLDIQRSVGMAQILAMQYCGLSMVYLDLGNLEDARNIAEEAIRIAKDNNARNIEALAKCVFGRILWKTDLSQSKEAEQHILQGIMTLDEQEVKAWSSMGQVFLAELYTGTGQVG